MSSERHYFQSDEAYYAIRDLARPGIWTVYVGLGATIDRTNVDWPTFVRKLLVYCAGDAISEEAIVRWVQELGPQRAATTAETLARGRYGDGWVQHIQDGIRQTLYSPRRHMGGRLLSALADWAHAMAHMGGSVVLVTANYDDYLYDELLTFHSKSEWAADVREPKLVVLGSDDGDRALPEGWDEPGNITCVHVHGFVPAEGKPARGIPAIGELSYGLTGPATRSVLKTVFAKSHVLVIGSSITDPPLVDTLIEDAQDRTGDEELMRLAFQPRQGMPWDRSEPRHRELLVLNERRLEMMGLKSITPDYYGQVSQVMSDASIWTIKTDADRLLNESDERRYDNRVERWWNGWFTLARGSESGGKPENVRQNLHYQLLAAALPSLRNILKASPDERLKIEVWVRWKPATDRQLGLWACSTGPWPDHPRDIRLSDISDKSAIKAVRVFCAGAPILFEREDESGSRWQSYYGYPIWHAVPDGRFMAGVVVVASRNPISRTTQSCLSEDNLKRVQIAALWLDEIGRHIMDDQATEANLTEFVEELRSRKPGVPRERR